MIASGTPAQAFPLGFVFCRSLHFLSGLARPCWGLVAIPLRLLRVPTKKFARRLRNLCRVSERTAARYNAEASPVGLAGSEGTFSICTFWYVEALARAGRLDEARLIFEKMLTYANHLGIYAEEIGPTGEQLGNFPQAFTHLALISAAVNLDRQLE